MAQYVFGSGIIYGTPLSDAGGAAVTTPTPLQFGELQEGSVEISFDNKPLYGNKQFPVAVGRTKGTISGKSKAARINGGLFNSLFFGQTLTSGILSINNDIAGSVVPTAPGPYTITPTVPGSGTWAENLGVRDAAGLAMTRVSNSPAVGQYSVSAGVYTFAAADAGAKVYIDFQYTATSSSAVKSTVTNQLMGYAPQFQADLYFPFQGKALVLTLHACIGSKLSFSGKNDDYMIPEFDFQGFANAAGDVLTWATTDR
ncbi:MAG: hypothetical protein HGB04_06535 [Chlorobiaceae bacterium]|nr:hypothetical protein [Chlorobiaceae bacterium]